MFILPAYLIVLTVSMLYVAYHGLPLVQALFYGIGPTVSPSWRSSPCAWRA